MMSKSLSYIKVAVLLLFTLSSVNFVIAQVSGGPSANCHITDGTFTACTNGQTEWSDVQPLFFSASNSYLYVNQDPQHTLLFLMYDFPNRTTALGPTDSVHIHFGTVENGSGGPALVFYDVFIPASGPPTVLENGQATPAGSFVAAAGFGASPNSAIPHITAELQVPLVGGAPPGVYSPDPIFWGAAPPTPTPTPSPSPTPTPDPCPTDPGKTYNNCVKKQANKNALVLGLEAIGIQLLAAECTAETIGACAPAEVALTRLAAATAAAAAYNAYVAGDPEGLIFIIPPDPNFTVFATPATYSISLPTQGVPADQAAAMNALMANLEQLVALQQAAIASIARAEGASNAGDQAFVVSQTKAAQQFSAQAGTLLKALPALYANVATALQAGGTRGTFAASDVQTFQSNFINNTFPPAVAGDIADFFNTLGQLGVSDVDKANIVQLFSLADPQAVALLGTGALPNALSDPSFAASLQELGTSLEGNGPSSVFLMGTDAVSFHRDTAFASQLWSHLGSHVAFINNFGVLGPTTIDGQPVTGFATTPSDLSGFSAVFFASPFTCCDDPATDPALGIAANAPAILSFIAGGGVIAIENFQGVAVWDSILGFTSAAGVIAGAPFPTGSDPGISTPAGVAAGFTGNFAGPNRYVDSSFIHQVYSDSFFAGQGFTSLIDAQAFGAGSGVVLQKGSSSTPTPPTTATAAVVEASVTGDTVADGRGLNPGDAPSLQDQIKSIVQFRVIQNPSIDATQLTTQLVNSLPPSILPPDQANTIINAVVGSLVPPPAVISGMPGPGCSLWPPNHKLVTVATVTASDAVGGILPGSFTVTGTSNEPSNDPKDPEIVITPNGSGGFVVQLAAERLGNGTGRIYTLTATATNSAGLTTTSTNTCTVPHDQGP
jgi:hypothetical protein